MTKNAFKPLLFIMAISLILAALAGCGKGARPVEAGTTAPDPVQTVIATPTPTPTPEPTPEPTPTPKPIVTISSIFPGDKPAGLDSVFAELNSRLEADISAKLELTWSPADKYDAYVAVAIASGGKVDFIWCNSSRLADYAAKGLIAPIDSLMAQYGRDIERNMDSKLFDSMKIDGKLMGLPSSGNAPLRSAGQAFIYREDLLHKYSLPKPDSVANMEAYFKAIAANEPELIPLSTGNAADIIARAYGSLGCLANTNGSVAYSINEDGTATCVAVQQAELFKQSVLKAREWYQEGWLAKSILSVKDPTAAVSEGMAAATSGDVNTVISMQVKLSNIIADAKLAVQPLSSPGFFEGNGGNALCLASSSKVPDSVAEFWNWIYTNQVNYDLLCYGVEGQDFTITGGRLALLNNNYSSFPSWIFSNVNFMRFPQGVPDDYVETVKHWNDNAAISSLIGFVFNTAPVKNELAKIKTIYANYYPLLNTGSGDPVLLLAEFGTKMTAAGQGKVVAEAQNQINAFLSSKQ